MFVMLYNYRFRHPGTIDNEQSIVNIYKFDKCKLEETSLMLKPSKKIAGKSRKCRMTEMSGPCDGSGFDDITVSVGGDEHTHKHSIAIIRNTFCNCHAINFSSSSVKFNIFLYISSRI